MNILKKFFAHLFKKKPKMIAVNHTSFEELSFFHSDNGLVFFSGYTDDKRNLVVGLSEKSLDSLSQKEFDQYLIQYGSGVKIDAEDGIRSVFVPGSPRGFPLELFKQIVDHLGEEMPSDAFLQKNSIF